MKGIPACQPFDPETGEGCEAQSCEHCKLVEILCADCARKETCDKRFKPKILPSNRRALSHYALCQKFNTLPRGGGLLDQDNRLIQQFQIIMDEVAKQEKAEMDAKLKEK